MSAFGLCFGLHHLDSEEQENEDPWDELEDEDSYEESEDGGIITSSIRKGIQAIREKITGKEEKDSKEMEEEEGDNREEDEEDLER